MRRRLISVLATCFLLWPAGESRAVVTDWYIDHSPVLLGQDITCTAQFALPNYQIQSFTWEIQGISQNGALTTWLDLQVNASAVAISMSSVGQLNIRLTVQYASVMGQMPPPNTVIVYSVNVTPPDSDVVVSGLNTPTELSQDGSTRVTILFEMRASGVAIGGNFGGAYVQEYLDSWEYFDPYLVQWVSMTYNHDWDPPVGQTSTLFYRQGNSIADLKYSNSPPRRLCIIRR